MKMLKIFSLIVTLALCLCVPQAAICQVEKLGDIKYTAPKGWTKSAKEHAVVFSQIDQAKGNFCFITLYAAAASTGTPQHDFAREWITYVIEPWGGEANPKTVTELDNGWTATAGGSPIDFQGNKAFAFLTVVSGFGKTVTTLGVLNDDSYLEQLQTFVEGMGIDKTGPTAANPTKPATSATMNVNTLAKEFQDNEIRANQTWIGKRVRVSGIVNTIKIVADGTIELTFKTSITNYNMARCHFNKSQSSGVATLTAHTEGTVEGTVRGLGGGFDNSKTYFLLEDCTVP